MESGFEEMKSDEEGEETQDPHSNKFRATGQLLLHYEEEPSFEGYLMFKGSKRQVRVEWRGGRVSSAHSRHLRTPHMKTLRPT